MRAAQRPSSAAALTPRSGARDVGWSALLGGLLGSTAPVITNTLKLVDEIHEPISALKQIEFSGKGKEPVARDVVVHVNDYRGQKWMPLRVFMPRDLV